MLIALDIMHKALDTLQGIRKGCDSIGNSLYSRREMLGSFDAINTIAECIYGERTESSRRHLLQLSILPELSARVV